MVRSNVFSFLLFICGLTAMSRLKLSWKSSLSETMELAKHLSSSVTSTAFFQKSSWKNKAVMSCRWCLVPTKVPFCCRSLRWQAIHIISSVGCFLKIIFDVNSIFATDMGHSRPGSFRRIETTLFVRKFNATFAWLKYLPTWLRSSFSHCSENASCAIMMFDVTNKASYRHLEDWHDEICSICNAAGRPPISIVVCGSKSDLEGRVVHPRHTVFPKKYGYPYFDVSSMSNFNFEAVFLALIRHFSQ